MTMTIPRRAVLFAAASALAASSAVAQAPGDSVRLRMVSNSSWQAGRLVQRERDSLVLRQVMKDQRYQVSSIERLEVWKKENAGIDLFVSTVSAASGTLIGQALWSDREPLTGSKAGDVAASAGVGLLVGIVYVLVHPGGWKQLKLQH